MVESDANGGARPSRARDPLRDDYQRALVAAYQEAVHEAGGDRSAVCEQGQDALVALLADVEMLLRKVTGDEIARRFAGRIPPGMFEEVLGEAQVAALEAAGNYDGRKGFASWLIGTRGGPARAAIRATLARLSRDVTLNQAQERTLGYARRAWADLRATGVEPSADEIVDLARDRCMAWAVEKVHDAWAREGRAPGDGPDTGPAAATELARAKLVRQGTWRALGELWDLLAVADPAILYDPTVPSVVDTVPDRAPVPDDPLDNPVAQVAVCGMPVTDTEAILAHLFSDVDDPTRPAGQDGQTPAGARRGRTFLAEILAAAQGRLRAPHAHFAALSPTLDAQFEVTGPAGPAATLAAARAQLT